MKTVKLNEYYQYPDSVKHEFRAIPWLQLLVYVPFFFQPLQISSLITVILCHSIIFLLSFKAYWVEDARVTPFFLIALTLSFYSSFYSVASIALFAITILISMAHSQPRIRLVFVFVIVFVYLLAAWIQKYSTTVFFIGLFFTLVNGLSIYYQIKSLYRQIATRHSNEEVKVLAASSERERIALDLHDALGHRLTGITLKAELALKLFDKNSVEAKKQLSEIIDLSRGTLKDVRETVAGYRQTNIYNELANARMGFGLRNIQFVQLINTDQLDGLTENTHQEFSWIIREAATNIMRHSSATKCQISLQKNAKKTELIISDNGQKTDKSSRIIEGNGIISIRQRCDKVNAKCKLSTHNGFIITVTQEIA